MEKQVSASNLDGALPNVNQQEAESYLDRVVAAQGWERQEIDSSSLRRLITEKVGTECAQRNFLKIAKTKFGKEWLALTIGENDDPHLHKTLYKKVGLETYLVAMTGNEANERAQCRHGFDEGYEYQPPAWRDLFDQCHDDLVDFSLKYIPDSETEAVETFLREHSEEDLFRWYHQDAPDLEDRVRTFLTNLAVFNARNPT